MKIGRPSNETFTKCQREGCEERAAPKQAYCSRAHAPFGYYGIKERGGHKNQVREASYPDVFEEEDFTMPVLTNQMMTENLRHKILTVVDGQSVLLPVMHEWSVHLRRCEEVLDWLIFNRLTGRNLVGFIHLNFPRSTLEPAKWVLMKIDRQSNPSPIIYGRDWK